MNFKFVFGAALAIGVAVGGQAQAQSSLPWNGYYLGVNAGYNWSDARQSATPGGSWVGDPDWPAISSQLHRTLSLDGAIGGGQVGRNWQSGGMVVGMEADFNWLNASSSYQTPTFAGIAGGTWDASGTAKVNWLTTLRGRAGFTNGNMLAYVTGGLALTDTKFSQSVNYRNVEIVQSLPLTTAAGGANAGSSSDLHVGFTVGAGIEYMIARNWSLKAEYLYVGMGKETATSSFTSPIDGFVYGVAHQNKFEALNIARVGLNYQFP